jgi:hypothetical protein
MMLGSDDIRFIEVIGADYEGFDPGALVADLKMGLGTLPHLRAFKRIAVVTDTEWMIRTLPAGQTPTTSTRCSMPRKSSVLRV